MDPRPRENSSVLRDEIVRAENVTPVTSFGRSEGRGGIRRRGRFEPGASDGPFGRAPAARPSEAGRASGSAPRDHEPDMRYLFAALTLIGCAALPAFGVRAEAPGGGTREGTPPAGKAAHAVQCGGFIGLTSGEGCQLMWSSCADGVNREVHCIRAGERFECRCVLGNAETSRFQSSTFCTQGTGRPDVDQPIFAEAAREPCGFAFAP